jgi:hypothetical protein
VFRSVPAQEIYEGWLIDQVPMRRAGERKWRPIDTLRCRAVPGLSWYGSKHVRGVRAKSRQGFHWNALEEGIPREHPATEALNTCPAARDSREDQSPGTAAGRAGFHQWRKHHRLVKRYVGPFIRKRLDASREGKAPKGESHECRWRETKPAGVRRA